jgi:hypothetical protein
MRLVPRHTGHVDVPDHLLVMGLGTLGRHPLEAIYGLEIDGTEVGGPCVTDAPALALAQPLHGVCGPLAAGHQRPFALRALVSTRGAAQPFDGRVFARPGTMHDRVDVGAMALRTSEIGA